MDEPEELFDVVDEHNQVIDVLPRSEVHRLGLRHRAVHVFLFRPDGRLLIHLRHADKVEFPSVWTSSASGHIASGESADDCVGRELQEELGVVTDLQLFLQVDACPETCMEFTWLYVGTTDAEVQPDPSEIADIRWVQPDELHKLLESNAADFSPAFRLLYQRFQTP